MDKNIARRNKGWMEFSVASVILWRRCVEPEVREWFDENGIWAIALKDYKKRLAKFLDDARRVAGLNDEWDEEKNGRIAMQLRKMVNLSGRDLLPADFEQERARTNPKYSVRFIPVKGTRNLSHNLWLRMV